MQITLTGTMYTRGLKYDSSNANYPYAVTNYMGYANGGYATQGQNRMFCYKGTGDAFNDKFRDSIKNPKVVLKLNLKRDGSISNTNAKTIEVYTYSEDYFGGASTPSGMTFEAQWDYMYYHYATKTIYTFTGTEANASIEITNKAEIQNIFDKGLSMYPAPDSSGQRNFWKVNSVSIEVSGETTEDAPELTINKSKFPGEFVDGVYYHPAGDTEFTCGVNYSQSIGVALSQLKVTAKDAAGTVLASTTTSSTSFTFTKKYWKDLPASGTIEVIATSAHGLPSATLVIHWVITHKNLSVVSPVSGSIIMTGQDVVLKWNLILPEGMPSAPDPTGYTVWPAFDDEEDYQVAYPVTDREFTLPAEDLAGHTKLKLLILDSYGDGTVARARGAGKLVLLYLQPSAAIHGVMLGTEYESGKYSPVLTASWDASGQTAFRLKSGDFDSGIVWGDAAQYTIPKVFPDGAHGVQLRIQDGNGNWGDWTEPVYATVVNAGDGGAVSITANTAGGVVQLSINGTPAGADVLIYRNSKLIAQIDGTSSGVYSYTDREASGICEYKVQMVTEDGFYSESETVTVNATPVTDGMVLEDGSWLALRYAVEHPTMYKTTKTEETYTKHYSGRAYPVVMRSGRKSRIMSMEYIDKDASLCDRLEAICGSVVVYKNVLGEMFRAEVNSVSAGRSGAWCTCSFRLTQCDEPAEVLYRME